MTIPTCQTCANCTQPGKSTNINDALCTAVTDPLTGAPMPVTAARQDTIGGWVMPCGYAGRLWKAKPQ